MNTRWGSDDRKFIQKVFSSEGSSEYSGVVRTSGCGKKACKNVNNVIVSIS